MFGFYLAIKSYNFIFIGARFKNTYYYLLKSKFLVQYYYENFDYIRWYH